MTDIQGATVATEIVFILDRSGSMAGSEVAVTSGFKEMVEKQRHQPGRAWVTTVLFNDELKVLHDHVPLQEIAPIGEAEYTPCGCTALLDALDETIQRISKIQRAGEAVIFIIMTDGYENSSREYTFSQVRDMISRLQEKCGWEFMFMGANMDAVAEASKYGIAADQVVDFQPSSEGIQMAFYCMDKCIDDVRLSKKKRK